MKNRFYQAQNNIISIYNCKINIKSMQNQQFISKGLPYYSANQPEAHFEI